MCESEEGKMNGEKQREREKAAGGERRLSALHCALKNSHSSSTINPVRSLFLLFFFFLLCAYIFPLSSQFLIVKEVLIVKASMPLKRKTNSSPTSTPKSAARYDASMPYDGPVVVRDAPVLWDDLIVITKEPTKYSYRWSLKVSYCITCMSSSH